MGTNSQIFPVKSIVDDETLAFNRGERVYVSYLIDQHVYVLCIVSVCIVSVGQL